MLALQTGSLPLQARPSAASRKAQAHSRCVAALAGPSMRAASLRKCSAAVALGSPFCGRSSRGKRASRHVAAAAAGVVCSAGAAERVVVAGATSRSGQLLIELLRKEGHEVIALSRDESAREVLAQRGASKVVHCDALDEAAVQKAFASAAPTIVVSMLGAAPSAMCSGPDFDGNKNLIDAAKAAGARRFVLVSALGAGNSLDCIPHASQDVMAPWLAEKTKAEEYLQASGLEYAVVRPGPLTDDATVSPAIVSADACEGRAYSMMSREELGRVAAEVTLSPAAKNVVLAVMDPGKVVIVAPYMRALEPWESLPFTVTPC